MDGNDPLFSLIERAADALVDLLREAERRGQSKLKRAANVLYSDALELRQLVGKD